MDVNERGCLTVNQDERVIAVVVPVVLVVTLIALAGVVLWPYKRMCIYGSSSLIAIEIALKGEKASSRELATGCKIEKFQLRDKVLVPSSMD